MQFLVQDELHIFELVDGLPISFFGRQWKQSFIQIEHVLFEILRNLFLSKALLEDALDVIPIEQIFLKCIQVNFDVLSVLVGPTILFFGLNRFSSAVQICIVQKIESIRRGFYITLSLAT